MTKAENTNLRNDFPKLGYRADIDGLRAIAILGVLVFHIAPTLLPGGFLGVDVFFVISGYLITLIIQRGLLTRTFSFVGFYERRIRRLAPALFVMMTLIGIAAAIWLWPTDLEAFGKSLKYVVISLGNVYFLDSVKDYFNEGAHRIPLLHTWSLAVEEQYYLLFPFVMLIFNKVFKTQKRMMTAIGLLLLASLVACFVRGQISPMSSFFLLPYRTWELMAGSILALSGFFAPAKKLAEVLGILGLGLVVGSFFLVSEQNLIPGVSAMPACLGVVLLIYSGSVPGVPSVRILSTKPMVGLGLTSYSVYLWHWPLAVFGRLLVPEWPWLGVEIFVASILLGWLSWKFVEQPFRKPKASSRKVLFACWAATTAVFILTSTWIRKQDGLPSRFPESVRYLLNFENKNPKYWVRAKANYDPHKVPVYGDTSSAPHIALWGDSHAEAMLPVLDRIALEKQVSFKCFILPGYVPVPGVHVKGESIKDKVGFTEAVFEMLLKDQSLTTVVMDARWSLPLWGPNEIKQYSIPSIYQHDFHTRDEIAGFYAERIKYTISRLLESGKEVVIIYPIPELGTNVPRLLANQRFKGMPLSERIPCPDFFQRNGFIINTFDSLPMNERLVRIKPHERLLNQNGVLVEVGGKPLYRDDNHIGEPGMEFIKDMLEPIFEAPKRMGPTVN